MDTATTQDLPPVERIQLAPVHEADACKEDAAAEIEKAIAAAVEEEKKVDEAEKTEEKKVDEAAPTEEKKVEKNPKACRVCGKEEGTKRCGACFGPYYCGDECLAKDWKAGHSKKCKIMGLPLPFLYSNRAVDRVFRDSLVHAGEPADTLLVCPADTIIENAFSQKVKMIPCWIDTYERRVVASAKLEKMMLVLKPWHTPRLTDDDVRTAVWVMENKKLEDLYELQISGSQLVAELSRFTNVDYVRLLRNVTSFKDPKFNRFLYFLYRNMLDEFGGDDKKFMMTWSEEGVYEAVCAQKKKTPAVSSHSSADSPPVVVGRRKMLALFKDGKYAEALEVASLVDRQELPAMLRAELLRSEAACHHRLKDFANATKKTMASIDEYERVFESTDAPVAETYRMLGAVTKDALKGTFTKF